MTDMPVWFEAAANDRVDGIVRDPAGVRRLLASLGRNTATDVAFKTLGEDAGGNGETLHTETVKSYLAALARLFVVEELRAWKPHLRSRAELRLRPKRCFVDPSLAVAALRSNSGQLMRDLSFFGLLFESRVDTETMGEPSKLMVVTAGGYGFEFSDCIAVVPIAALGP